MPEGGLNDESTNTRCQILPENMSRLNNIMSLHVLFMRQDTVIKAAESRFATGSPRSSRLTFYRQPETMDAVDTSLVQSPAPVPRV